MFDMNKGFHVKIKEIKHTIWCGGKLISTHKSFYLACLSAERKVKKGKISKDYVIETKILKEIK